MSLFYTKSEPHVTVIAPADGCVLPFEETPPCENEAVALFMSSNIVVAPINGTICEIDLKRNAFSILGNTGEKLILKAELRNICIPNQIDVGRKIQAGERLFSFIDGNFTPLLSLSLENSDEFRAITVFEGICHAAETEIMSFCR